MSNSQAFTAASNPEPPESLLGKKLDHYRLESIIGRGGAGIVYLARDTHLGRRVAVKVLAERTPQRPATLQRFLQEARLAAQLNHLHAVTIHEVNQAGEIVYIVMEWMDGGSLQTRLDRHGPLAWQAAVRAMRGACRGLDAAHRRRLVHRDIKPGNLLIDGSGLVKIGDFGLARATHASSHSLSSAGLVVGTPWYMSPEQCEGELADPRSDIYSMGATFFALLTGAPPFPGTEPLQVAFAHCSAPIPNPQSKVPEVPSRCVEVIQRAMAKRPAERFQSAEELLDELGRCAIGSQPGPQVETTRPRQDTHIASSKARRRRRRLEWAVGTGVGLGLFVCLLLLVSTSSPNSNDARADQSQDDLSQEVSRPDPRTRLIRADSQPSALERPAGRNQDAPDWKQLFAQPGRAELRLAHRVWSSTETQVSTWREVEPGLGRMQLVSYLSEGDELFCLIRHPDGRTGQKRYPALLLCSGTSDSPSPHDLRLLKSRFPQFDNCFVFLPVFRGQTLELGRSTRRVRSAGEAGNPITEVQDLIGLLGLVTERLSQVDPDRILAVGTGSRGSLAMLWSILDRRVAAVIAAEADTDAFQPRIHEAVAQAYKSGIPPESRLAARVYRDVVEPLREGVMDLPTARQRLLSLSPLHFAPLLPPTQIYYGAFSNQYDVEQARAIRESFARHAGWQRQRVYRHFTAGPNAPQTIRLIQQSVRPWVSRVLHDDMQSPLSQGRVSLGSSDRKQDL